MSNNYVGLKLFTRIFLFFNCISEFGYRRVQLFQVKLDYLYKPLEAFCESIPLLLYHIQDVVVKCKVTIGKLSHTGRPGPPRALQHIRCQATPPDRFHVHQQSRHVSCQVLHVRLAHAGRGGAAGL